MIRKESKSLTMQLVWWRNDDAAAVFAHDDFLVHADFHLALVGDFAEAATAGIAVDGDDGETVAGALADALVGGDVCVVSCKPGLGGAAMPSKMLSIMSAGRAVVASFDQGELTYILEQNNCGAYAPAGDVKEFAELIRNMEGNREVCQKMGENARKLILQKFTKEVV